MTIPPIIPDNLKAYLLKIARNQALKNMNIFMLPKEI